MCHAQLGGEVFHLADALAWVQLTLTQPTLYVWFAILAVCCTLADYLGLFSDAEELLGNTAGEVRHKHVVGHHAVGELYLHH